jgi:hypothetical protein
VTVPFGSGRLHQDFSIAGRSRHAVLQIPGSSGQSDTVVGPAPDGAGIAFASVGCKEAL